MQLRIINSIVDESYQVRMVLKDFSAADLERAAKFGNPTVELGGSFDDTATYDLPAREVELREGSELFQEFDLNDHVDAKARANTWSAEIQTRLDAALTAWRALDDDFTSDTTVEV
jgi:hypothetical protein